MANRLTDLLAMLPGDAPLAAREAIDSAREGLQKAADALADAAESPHRG